MFPVKSFIKISLLVVYNIIMLRLTYKYFTMLVPKHIRILIFLWGKWVYKSCFLFVQCRYYLLMKSRISRTLQATNDLL